MDENLVTRSVPSPYNLRSMLDDLVRSDLLGPAGGPDEIVDEPTVRGRYIVGVLAPTRPANSDTEKSDSLFDEDENIGEDQSDLALGGGDDDDEEGRADSAPPKAVSMMPAAIGLTFSVDGAATAIQVTARWGRYVRTAHPDPERVTKAGKPIRVWQRIPAGDRTETFALREGPIGPWSPDPSCPDVRVSGRVRRRGDEWSITLHLINGQREPQRPKRQSDEYDGKDSAWLFQPELIVTAPDGTPIFSRRPQLNHKADDEERAMAMLYRRDVEFGVGHGVAVHTDLAPGEWERAVSLRTEVMPTHEVAQMTPPTAADVPLLGEVLLDMRDLAQLEDGEFAAALNPLTAAYADWIAAQAQRLTTPTPDLTLYATAAMTNLNKARANLERIQAGIDLLAVDPQAAAAFRFANQAMWQQRIHTLYADRRRRDEKVTLDAVDQPENRRWRPFQLAFILLNLP
ncbi:MAG: hypothetical protein KDE31_29200, partial [Caldilineaceae bacterium]|nr:hypothetical protein [Caldilineaceae bacterium]